jgi:hypothetical protein
MRSAFALNSILEKFLTFFVYAYVLALTCSMGAMEGGAMGIALFFILIVISDRFCQQKSIEWHTTGAELPIFLLLIAIAVGLLINNPTDFISGFGSIRNVLLIFFIGYSLQVIKNLNRVFAVIVGAAFLISIYAIWQHYTGVDLWRHSNRALVDLPLGDRSVYQSVGFFSHHLTFAHSYMMLVALPWAAFLLSKKSIGKSKGRVNEDNQASRLFLGIREYFAISAKNISFICLDLLSLYDSLKKSCLSDDNNRVGKLVISPTPPPGIMLINKVSHKLFPTMNSPWVKICKTKLLAT